MSDNLETSPTEQPTWLVRQDEFEFTDLVAQNQLDTLVAEWTVDAAAKHASVAQQPEKLDDGLAVHFKQVSLFHGSSSQGIKLFNPAEETTIGVGFYATSMPDQAIGYAMERSYGAIREKVDGQLKPEVVKPTAYELLLTDITLVDLREQNNVDRFMPGFADYLENWLKQPHSPQQQAHIDRLYGSVVQSKIDTIRNGYRPLPPWAKNAEEVHRLGPGTLKNALFTTGGLFTEYVTGLGYDGVIAFEGGERSYTGEHDSWVIMRNLDQMQVVKEVPFEFPEVKDTDSRRAFDSQQPKFHWGDLPQWPENI